MATNQTELWQEKQRGLQPVFPQTPIKTADYLRELALTEAITVPANMQQAVDKLATRIQQGGILISARDNQENLIAVDMSQFLPLLANVIANGPHRGDYAKGLVVMNAAVFFCLVRKVNPGLEATMRGMNNGVTISPSSGVAIFTERLAPRIETTKGRINIPDMHPGTFNYFVNLVAQAFQGPDYLGQPLTNLRRPARASVNPPAIAKVALAAAIPPRPVVSPHSTFGRRN